MTKGNDAISSTDLQRTGLGEFHVYVRSSHAALAGLIVVDPVMRQLYELVERLAPVTLPVLVTGETGTGKEFVATALHVRSSRAKYPLRALNCAALNAELVESELFGHAKGAFSGAVADRTGLIEAASGSTLLLDEVGELPLQIQAKLLRVLESSRVTRVGEVHERKVNIRIVAATNRDLAAEVEAGRFRRDLYFRLSAALLYVPPLRQRPIELQVLAQAFLDQAVREMNRSPMWLSDEAMKALRSYHWPGNVRELRHVIQYIAATHIESEVLAEQVGERLTALGEIRPDAHADDSVFVDPPRTHGFRSLNVEVRELEMKRIQEALMAAEGNQTRAAELLSVPIRTLYDKVRRYGIHPNRPDHASNIAKHED